MKTLKALTLIGAALVTSLATAETAVRKAPHRIDFNKMIEENNQKKSSMEKQTEETVAKSKAKEKAEVVKFVDLEIGVDQPPSVADRRYDSIGGPRTMDLKELRSN